MEVWYHRSNFVLCDDITTFFPSFPPVPISETLGLQDTWEGFPVFTGLFGYFSWIAFKISVTRYCLSAGSDAYG